MRCPECVGESDANDPRGSFHKVDCEFGKRERAAHRLVTPFPLVLHPDPYVRDPYGVLSRGMMEDLRRYGEAFIDGYRAATDRMPHYTTLRDHYLGLVDIPYVLACELAMFLTYTERYSNQWIFQPVFRPVL